MEFKNGRYVLKLNSRTGAIESLVCGGKEFVSTVLPLWQARLRNGAEQFEFTSDDAEYVVIVEEDNTISLGFSGFEKFDFSAKVTAKLSDRIEWNISYVNKTGMCVEWIDFPQIAVPDDLVRQGGSGRILIDFNEGMLVEDSQFRNNTMWGVVPDYPSQGMFRVFPAVVESQFLAYYDDKCGLYFAAEDTERSYKGVDFYLCENFIKLQFRLYPGVFSDCESYSFNYPMVMDFFDGDWHDAAEKYRVWFENNLPEGLAKVSETKETPEWYYDSPLVVTYPVQGVHDMDEPKPNKLFPYENSLPILDKIAEETGSRIMSLLMHWEGTAPWAPPYVWPPLGGEKMLCDYCDKLHERNFLLGVYCSGTAFTIESNLNEYNNRERIEKENLYQYFCSPPGDSKQLSTICQGQRKSLDMCVSQEFTKKTLWDEAEKMASCGLDYIQILDQNHGGTPYLCYSSKHGHPPVPGKWMVDHMKELLQGLKTAVGDKVLLGCESAAAEAYVPYLKLSDNRFNLNYRSGRPVPVYAYVYHEYLHNFSGNSVCSMDIINITKSPDCHLMRIAYSYLAGDLMTVVLNQDGEVMWSWGQRDFSVLPERAPFIKFIKIATAYRRGSAKKYLVTGKMIKPLEVSCKTVPMYKAGNTDYVTDYPAVLTTAWQAEDGSKAQLLANYLKEDVKCHIDIKENTEFSIVDEKGNVTGIVKADGEITVPACSVVMVRI